NPRFFGTYIDLGAYEAQCTIAAAADESEFAGELSEGDNYLYSECEVLAGIQTASGGVSGSLRGRAWVEDDVVSHKNARFVRRHNDRLPLDEEDNGAARISPFITKEEFQAYKEEDGTQNGFTPSVNNGE